MKEARYHFAKRFEHWTLEDWKKVIWSDETSVLLGHRRGGYKVWRRSNEAFKRSCIQERWKGFSEFMFWGCFLYNFKGLCYIWKSETTQECKESKQVIGLWNTAIELALFTQWDLKTKQRCSNSRYKGGRKPQWKFSAETGKFVQTSKGGINW
jgi:hypothetical protein